MNNNFLDFLEKHPVLTGLGLIVLTLLMGSVSYMFGST